MARQQVHHSPQVKLTGVSGSAGITVKVCRWIEISGEGSWLLIEKELFWSLEGYTDVGGEVAA